MILLILLLLYISNFLHDLFFELTALMETHVRETFMSESNAAGFCRSSIDRIVHFNDVQ